jgi:hypothetical protein
VNHAESRIALATEPRIWRHRLAAKTSSPGVVNLPSVRRHGGECGEWSEASRRFLGEFGEFAPCDESGSELFAAK